MNRKEVSEGPSSPLDANSPLGLTPMTDAELEALPEDRKQALEGGERILDRLSLRKSVER